MKRWIPIVLALSIACSAQVVSVRHHVAAAGSPTTARSFDGSTQRAYNSVCYLSGASNFTIAFWFKPANLTQTNKYLVAAINNTGSYNQASVIWGYTDNTVEFFGSGHSGATDPRTNSSIVVSDTNWHHIAYRKNGSAWDKFLDGVKTSINASADFAIGTINSSCGLFVANDGSPTSSTAMSAARLYISTSALTDGQIAAMAGTTCGTSGVSSTVGYWLLLGNNSPEPESPPSPNTNVLTLVNSPPQTTGPVCSGS